MEFFVSFLKLSGFSQFAIPGLQLFMIGDAECSFIIFFFTLKRTLGYYYGNDQNTTKTIKSRLWLCSNCQLYTFHSVLYVFSERKTGYLMPPYALAIHSSGSVLQEWWSAPKASLVERSYLFLCLFDKDEHWKIWFCGLKYDNRLGTKEIKYSR